MAALVLYVAVLDRLALGAHLRRLSDPQAPLKTRLVACAHASDTFFYRRTALRQVRELSQDSETPEALRPGAAKTIRILRHGLAEASEDPI